MKIKKKAGLALMLALLLLLAACGGGASTAQPGVPAGSTPSNTPAVPASATASVPTASSNAPAAASGSTSAIQQAPAVAQLYIGYNGQAEPLAYDIGGQVLSPEVLIAAVAETTGWDLSLAGTVTQSGAEITVPFSPACALFVGPPDPQKDEYHVFDTEDLVFSVLGSVSETLKQNLGVSAVYFCGEDGAPLVLPNLAAQDITLPADQPYTAAVLEALIAAE